MAWVEIYNTFCWPLVLTESPAIDWIKYYPVDYAPIYVKPAKRGRATHGNLRLRNRFAGQIFSKLRYFQIINYMT